MNDTSYNGWRNYETWNVALYIQNEFSFYQIAKDCSKMDSRCPYAAWLFYSKGLRKGATPDGVMWNDPRIDIDEIDSMIRELT